MKFIRFDLNETAMIRSSFAVLITVSLVARTAAFTFVSNHRSSNRLSKSIRFNSQNDKTEFSFQDSDASSKGIVSSLTWLVNSFLPQKEIEELDNIGSTIQEYPPKSPQELLERIRDDYIVRNYLWTGDIDLAAFQDDCRFTDPTLSFQGKDQFVKNLANLRPIVEILIREPDGCRSELLDIQLNQEYVQTRWNMVGELTGLPWKPKVDVIGQTKFWFQKDNQDGGFRTYFYDEEWEIPAAKALLQLITPAGTVSNGSA